MKIVYIQQHFATGRGEAGVRGYNLVKTMVARGHEVTVICGRNWRDSSLNLASDPGATVATTEMEGFRLIQILVDYSNHLGFWQRVRSFVTFAVRSCLWAQRAPADLVYVSSTPLTITLPALWVRAWQRKPYVLEVRDLWPELPIAMGIVRNPVLIWVLKQWEALSYRAAWRLVGLAPGIQEGIITQGQRKPEHVYMVPNGSDTDSLRPMAWGQPRRLLPVGSEPTRMVLGYTGTHGPANGLDAVLNAAAELQGRGVSAQEVTFALIGDGKDKPRLQARAAELGLSNVVFTGLFNKSQYNEVLAELDVGMQILQNVPAFYRGTSPNKFFDYLAVGRPVLVNYPGWMSDLATEHRCGVAVPPDDPKAFADAVLALRARRAEWAAMGADGRRLAEAQFRQQTILSELMERLEHEAARDLGVRGSQS